MGDFVLQPDWCAMNKSKHSFPCLVHVLIYTSCFLFLTVSWKALLVIGVTHFILDRWHIIIQKLIWMKNHINPWFGFVPFENCKYTGYFDRFEEIVKPGSKVPDYLYDEWGGKWEPRLNYITIWLYIITDNFLHLTINYMALKYLG